MTNILLLGDSIRQNYQEYVKEQMKEVANVYYTNDNGRFCMFTLRYLHEWIYAISNHGEIQFDVIHFNCGLWDVLRLSNEDTPFTSELQYEDLLKRIIKRIRYLCPDAKIIFALTTEIVEPGFEPGVNVGQRKNEDIRKYNKIAEKVCKNMQVEIDDLWKISIGLPSEAHSDLVHYDTELGIKNLGNQVVSCLKKYVYQVEI